MLRTDASSRCVAACARNFGARRRRLARAGIRCVRRARLAGDGGNRRHLRRAGRGGEHACGSWMSCGASWDGRRRRAAVRVSSNAVSDGITARKPTPVDFGAAYPSEPVTLSGTAELRGRHVVTLRYRPVQYRRDGNAAYAREVRARLGSSRARASRRRECGGAVPRGAGQRRASVSVGPRRDRGAAGAAARCRPSRDPLALAHRAARHLHVDPRRPGHGRPLELDARRHRCAHLPALFPTPGTHCAAR